MTDNKELQEDSKVYYCSDCNAEVLVGDKVCQKCGSDLSKIVEDEVKNASLMK